MKLRKKIIAPVIAMSILAAGVSGVSTAFSGGELTASAANYSYGGTTGTSVSIPVGSGGGTNVSYSYGSSNGRSSISIGGSVKSKSKNLSYFFHIRLKSLSSNFGWCTLPVNVVEVKNNKPVLENKNITAGPCSVWKETSLKGEVKGEKVKITSKLVAPNGDKMNNSYTVDRGIKRSIKVDVPQHKANEKKITISVNGKNYTAKLQQKFTENGKKINFYTANIKFKAKTPSGKTKEYSKTLNYFEKVGSKKDTVKITGPINMDIVAGYKNVRFASYTCDKLINKTFRTFMLT